MAMKSLVKEFGLKKYPGVDHLGTYLGYEMISADRAKGRFEAKMTITENHLSAAQRMHGGALAAFLDYACGAAVMAQIGSQDDCSTIKIKTSFFRPVMLGDVLIARTQVDFNGHRIAVSHGHVYRNDETEPVSMASGTFNVHRG